MRLLLAPLALLAVVAGCASQAPAPRNFVVYFQTDDAIVTPVAQQVIATAAAATHDHPAKIVVEGHADGGTPADASLADQRALAVIHALVDDGIDANNIEKLQGAPPSGETGVAAHQVIIRLLPSS